MCKDCYEKLRKELADRGCFNFEVSGLTECNDRNVLLIPCTYRVKKTKSDEFVVKSSKTRFIAKYCPNCGKPLKAPHPQEAN